MIIQQEKYDLEIMQRRKISYNGMLNVSMKYCDW